MNQITYGYFDESGNTGTTQDYYVVAVVLFHTKEDALKAKAVLKRERKNAKTIPNEFKFHKMHTGSKVFKVSLKRVLTKLAKSNIQIYSTVVKKPQKQRFAFEIAKWKLVIELFKFLYSQKNINRIVELKSDDNFFGHKKEDHRRIVCGNFKGNNGKNGVFCHELSYEEYNDFVKPEDVQKILAKKGYELKDWKIFTIKARDSQTEQGIQIADLIAGAIYQKYNNKNDEYFNIIKPKIIRLFD